MKQLVPKLKGKGFYSGFLNDVGNLVGGGIGSLFGNADRGRSIGSSAGSWLSKITGFGSYKVNSNTLMSDTGPPVFANGAEGTVVISRREFVGDVIGSTLFQNNVFNINPGNAALFPWLSQVAGGFEQYEMLGLVFEYRPTSGNAVSSTNNALGVVVMSTNYDVLDPAFNSKQEMESYQYTVSTVPSSIAIHPVECKKGLNTLDCMYVRKASFPQEADQRFYDMGNFQVATVGQQLADVTLGELWVSYHVKMLKPKLGDPTRFAWHATANSRILEQVVSNPQWSSSTNQTTSIGALPYVASTNSISIDIAQAGNYSWKSTATLAATNSTSIAFTFIAELSTDVEPVGDFYDVDGVAKYSTCFTTGATTASIYTSENVYNATSAVSASGCIAVHSGGGTAVFNCGTSAATITDICLVLDYEGYQKRDLSVGTSLTEKIRNPRGMRNLTALESRLRILEKSVATSSSSSSLLSSVCDEEKDECYSMVAEIPKKDLSKRSK